MADLNRSDTVSKTITVVQEEPNVLLTDDDNDDETIRMPTEPSIDTSIFESFADFELDLSCLSSPSSPNPSSSHLPPATPSPPASPILSRSISFASTSQTPMASSLSAKKLKKASSPQLSTTMPAGSRGSWPLIKYAGRGTPIDHSRRREWGGFSGDEVAEDGMLFSAARSTSFDSNAIRPSQRSLSPEWNYSSNMSSSLSHSTHSEASHHKNNSLHEPPPELAPLEDLELNKADEWDSIMKTVLSPTREVEPPTPTVTNDADEDEDVKEENTSLTQKDINTMATTTMTPEQMELLNNGVEIDLDIHRALDLALGQPGGMAWFDPTAVSRRESMSVYSSQIVTPRASLPASLRPSEHRSTTSTKADLTGDGDSNAKSPVPWWQKMVMRIRRARTIITIHKNRC